VQRQLGGRNIESVTRTVPLTETETLRSAILEIPSVGGARGNKPIPMQLCARELGDRSRCPRVRSGKAGAATMTAWNGFVKPHRDHVLRDHFSRRTPASNPPATMSDQTLVEGHLDRQFGMEAAHGDDSWRDRQGQCEAVAR